MTLRDLGAAALATLLAAPATASAAADKSASADNSFLMDSAVVPNKPAAADKARAKNSAMISQYYQEALQSYVHGDYRSAIIKWTAIIKEAPEQATAATMILDARQKILMTTRLRRRHAFDFIAAGQYRMAYVEMQALLDQDPGDPQLQALQRRLSGVIKLAPAVLPRTKASRAAILGLKGYLSLPPDLTLAHNGLRYAGELAPDDEIDRKFLALLVAEYPVLTTLDPVTPGMTLLEYKHAVALHQIYDGKYHAAVLALNEILALDPGDLVALKRLGSAYYSLGRMGEARDAWTAALRIAPRDRTLKRFLDKIKNHRYGADSPDSHRIEDLN
jgi:tetratricopeptide (TPR) repeat protein